MLLRSDARGATQALSSLQREIALNRAQRAVMEAFSLSEPEEVTLPGYHIFSSTSTVRATQWLAPRPTGDFEDCVAAYEDLADRDLDAAPRLDRIVTKLIPRQSEEWLPPQPAGQWWPSAVAMLALLSNCVMEPVQVGEDELLLQANGLKFRVTPRGMHSNFRGRFMYVKRPLGGLPGKAGVGAITVRHPLACAVRELPDHAKWAVAYLLWCEQSGVIQKITAESILKVGAAKRGRRLGSVRKRAVGADGVAAVYACRDLASMGGTIADLYSAAVPDLMSARDFKRRFSCPWTHPTHRITDTVREKLEEFLATVERGL